MAKTVAEIDGDSSGLVSELGKAKKAMGDLGGQGKKLTDQLRQVADEADVAAGNLVTKLGGPGAIKAIGAVGLAFEGASRLAGAFLDSSEALFRSYGDEGQKVWDETEKSLFAIKGAFAEAVLGGGDVEDMGARLKGIFDGVKIAVDALLLPLKGLSTLVITLGDAFEETNGYVIETSDSLDQLASKARLDGLTKNAAGIEGIRIKLMQMRGETEALLQVEIAREIKNAEGLKTDILRTELQSDALSSAAVVVAKQGEIDKKASEAQQAYIRDLGEEKLSLSQQAEARRIYNETRLKEGQAVMAQAMAERKGVSAANQAQLDELDQQIAGFKELATAKRETKTNTGSAGKADEPELAPWQKELLERVKATREVQALRAENDAQERVVADEALKRAVERMEAETKAKMEAIDRVNAYSKQMEEEHDAEIHARGELTEAEQQERNDAILASIKDRTTQELTLYAQTATKQAIIGKLSAKEAAEMARKQLGNVIMGLGDKAMAEAGIMAAGLNPLAVPMAAAGVAAYAIGGALSADKKAAGSTPATEKAESAAPASNNYAFNLRVDSVFADGESVARQFAMMQESARQRGLLQQGAY